MAKLFRDNQLQEAFDSQGYVKIPFLDSKGILDLSELYERTKSEVEINSEFYTSIWSENRNYKKKVDDQIKTTLNHALDNTLIDYQTIFANLMVKKAGSQSKLQPHQDWTFVDEPTHCSITVWVPLIDVDKNNGALALLPKSQALTNYVRPRFGDCVFQEAIPQLENNEMEIIEMRAGEALLINSRLIHASPNNFSQLDRIAVSVVVAPKQAQLIHYIKVDGVQYKLDVDTNFFIENSCFSTPNIQQGTPSPLQTYSPIGFEQLEKIIQE